MLLLAILWLALQLFAPAAYALHTGFNYGAFWSDPAEGKTKDEYANLFKIAYSLNTSVAFDSARLFTCRQPGTTEEPIAAFEAAIETHTYVLLGFYLAEVKQTARKPDQKYETNAEMLDYELSALEKALKKHGQKLADLVIGISVGNEDLEMWESGSGTGVPQATVENNLDTVRKVVSGAKVSPSAKDFPNIAKYMKDKAIGHTDTAPHAAKFQNLDFIGMNAYPYWSRDSPAGAKGSYFGSVDNTKKAIGETEIWLTEVGWPFEDKTSAVKAQNTASKENLQKYWNEIGCDIFGKYTTFWFELQWDTVPDQPDWAVLDRENKPRIDMSCGIGRKVWEHDRQDTADSTAPPSEISSSSKASSPSSAPPTSSVVSSPSTTPPSATNSALAPLVSSAPDAASKGIYTGFSYGAFWSENEPKLYKDFLRQFTLAKNLPNVPVPFTSARLYQAAQWGAPTEPSEAFQAAVETNTTLLLGIWLPLENELIALDKAFQKYGQKLADLVIGISIGSEDIYRGSEECKQKENRPCPMGATPEEVMGNITHAETFIQKKPWYKLFKTPPPIGHVDTARNAALKNSGFVGTNIFPFWHPDPIDKALESFELSLNGVKERAGNVPVWITETGWPSSGTNVSTATLDSMQKYWSTVGCSLFGKYTTFWFELEKDTHDLSNLDWGLIDTPSQKPKIKDLSCPVQPSPILPPSASGNSSIIMPKSSAAAQPPSSLPSTSSAVPSLSSSLPSISLPDNQLSVPGSSRGRSTVHVTSTVMVTVQPSAGTGNNISIAAAPSSQKDIITVTNYVTVELTVHGTPESSSPKLSASAIPSEASSVATATSQTPQISAPASQAPPPASSRPVVFITEPTGCITVSKDANGQLVTIASNPPVDGKCAIPTYVPPSSANAKPSVQSSTTAAPSPAKPSAPAQPALSKSETTVHSSDSPVSVSVLPPSK